LRIGVSTAKGLCYGSDIPLIALDTLKIMFAAAVKQTDDSDNSLFCPMIDARRMEVYCEILTIKEILSGKYQPKSSTKHHSGIFFRIA